MMVGARLAGATLAASLLIAAQASGERTPPQPIPEGPNAGSLPVFIGSPATANPLTAPEPPRHPFMAPNGLSNLHNDAYQTDAYRWLGPLGKDMVKLETFVQFQQGECASITFDAAGRLVTVCIAPQGPTLTMFDAQTLDRLATFGLPLRTPSGINIFQSFASGGYFYLDNRDRAVIPTTDRHIYIVRETGEPGFALEANYDLSSYTSSDDQIFSALPDFSGRIWFASSKGVIGTLDPGSGAVKTYNTGEAIGNSFAVGEDGAVYVVTDVAMYRFDAGGDGSPTVSWREIYPNTGELKPGQTQRGSGTTPTLMGSSYVAITDNADPMNVVVYRRARSGSGSRLVCSQPVFGKGASATDQSLIATDRSMIVENNFGYANPAVTEQGGTTVGGLSRVDINSNGAGCHTVWTSGERAPSVVPKLSLGNGLVYTYTKDPRPDNEDAWYLTAIDFRTGRTVYKRLGGEGLGHNNQYAPITIAPNGNLYLGVLGGLLMLRDKVPPTAASSGGGAGAGGGVRLTLSLAYRAGRSSNGRRCARSDVRAELGGRDTAKVRSVDFFIGRVRLGRDSRAPFRKTISRRSLRRGNVYRVRARANLRSGGSTNRSRSFRNCLRDPRRARFTG